LKRFLARAKGAVDVGKQDADEDFAATVLTTIVAPKPRLMCLGNPDYLTTEVQTFYLKTGKRDDSCDSRRVQETKLSIP
jgi:hypothetical protein